ncbi:unnamed protein product, partial [Urochloa humidicola]
LGSPLLTFLLSPLSPISPGGATGGSGSRARAASAGGSDDWLAAAGSRVAMGGELLSSA